ncbi:MAG: hypothetical protein KDC83_02205, partial [Flavobacteriales bacterium]|nr:hypothetical protein [Flavobacteriales bacterium]
MKTTHTHTNWGFAFFLLFYSSLAMSQNSPTQHPEPDIIYGLTPERGQVFEQGYGNSTLEGAYDVMSTNIGVTMAGWTETTEGGYESTVWIIDSIGELISTYTK